MNNSIFRPNGGNYVPAMLAALIASLMITATSHSAEPVPNEFKDFTMGMSEGALVEKIKNSGKMSDEESIIANRKIIKWIPPDNPYYQAVSFRFTEKNRLFLVHLLLKDEARQDAQSLKKSFFDKYKFSWEDPYRLRIKESDVILYGEGDAKFSFLDFTDVKTGAKAYELFSRVVSSEDRPVEPSDGKNDKLSPPSEESAVKKPVSDNENELGKSDSTPSEPLLEKTDHKAGDNSDRK